MFVVAGIPYAHSSIVSKGAAVFLCVRVLETDQGLNLVSPCPVQHIARVPRQTITSQRAKVDFASHQRFGSGRGRRGQNSRTAGQKLGVGALADVLNGQYVFLCRCWAQNQLAKQGLSPVGLRVWTGAVDVGFIVDSQVAQGTSLARCTGQQPLHAITDASGDGCSCAETIVIATPVSGDAPAKRFRLGTYGVQKIQRLKRDEVDQTSKPIRSVQNRTGATHQLYSLDQVQRQGVAPKGIVSIHIASRGARAIDQHQYPVATQTANVEPGVSIPPGGVAGASDGEACRCVFDRDVGQVFDQVLDIAHLTVLEVTTRQYIDGHRQIVTRLLVAGPTDDNLLQTYGGILCLCRPHGSTGQSDQHRELSNGVVARKIDRSHGISSVLAIRGDDYSVQTL